MQTTVIGVDDTKVVPIKTSVHCFAAAIDIRKTRSCINTLFKKEHMMELNNQQRLDLLQMEMGLLQTTLDKYDDLIFRNRNWFITLWMGTLGLGFTIASSWFPLFAVFLSLLYWFIEGMMRYKYWYKYVLRYRTLREHINKQPPDIESLSIYDLTNHYMENHETEKDKLRKSFLKLEPSVVYGGMALGSLGVWLLILLGVIELSRKSSIPIVNM